jgi:hypothetical protein
MISFALVELMRQRSARLEEVSSRIWAVTDSRPPSKQRRERRAEP